MQFKFSAVLSGFILCMLILSSSVNADDTKLKPFVLGGVVQGTIGSQLIALKSTLTQAGFDVVGEYSPYPGAQLVVVTNDALKSNAEKSEFGAYGATLRVSLTATEAGVQIAYTNAKYMAPAYRMQGDLTAVAASLESALGKQQEFGSKQGVSAKKLRKYHYMMTMPYYDDQVKLASHATQQEALAVVEANLAAGVGASKVYRVDLANKQESVFGVAITEGSGADESVMKTINTAQLKATAHLPYELIVSQGKVFMLHGKFRIAVNFPDLGMGTFMKISGAPGDIEDQLELASSKPE